jgi:hypothetical protein
MTFGETPDLFKGHGGRKEGNDYIQDQPLGLKRTAIT